MNQRKINKDNTCSTKTTLKTSLFIGSLWGIFESTVGYILHLLPINIGFLIWFPVALFFLTKAYKESGKPSTVLLTAAFASSIKLLNLLLPGHIDRVINPAISVILEGVTVFAVIAVFHRFNTISHKKRLTTMLTFCVNSLWRLSFIAYLALIVPEWMREISILQSTQTLLRFLIIDNIISSIIALVVIKAYSRFKDKTKYKADMLKVPESGLVIVILIAVNIGLQLFSM